MRLSTRSRYGLRALVVLADKGDVHTSGAALARATGISKKYLDSILRQLRERGFLTATHGARGGYSLARPAEDITAEQIVEALENEITLVPCVEDPGECERSPDCPTLPVWRAATEAIRKALRDVKLSDLVDPERAEPMYHI